MKFLFVFCLHFFVFSNFVFAETKITNSDILQKSDKCLRDLQNEVCKNLILLLERIQISEFEQNRFKCQSSILGLQTELIEAYYFEKNPQKQITTMRPYVIKNC